MIDFFFCVEIRKCFCNENIKESIISGIFDSIILNDIATRGQIRDTKILKSLVSFLADNVVKFVNPTKIANILKNEKIEISNHAINRYLELLKDAFLFYELKPFDIIEYYQVTYQIPQNNHETDNLLLIKDNFKKTLITGRYEVKEEIKKRRK